ncbi:hypothetical protein [Rivihabitans pingtungensis]|uniref:hypothetical protein n=1 Tax=Rivihabitans pingtungensis TaxID=1054498 RepID=UPI0023F3D290|nr:hypothetical protein [Rivihabitans pingtungensis]HNX70686.1 hypothetical protein [Rivihabitans pingtungensis]
MKLMSSGMPVSEEDTQAIDALSDKHKSWDSHSGSFAVHFFRLTDQITLFGAAMPQTCAIRQTQKF